MTTYADLERAVEGKECLNCQSQPRVTHEGPFGGEFGKPILICNCGKDERGWPVEPKLVKEEHAIAKRYREMMELRSEEQALPPTEQILRAKELSEVLMDMVEQTGAYAVVGEKKYLQFEAWQFIGAANRVSASPEYVVPVEESGIIVAYESKVNLVDSNGIVVGSGIMQCGLDEFVTRGKEGRGKHLAAMSMAETRAASKAYRLKYSWIAMLGGFATTAEEMSVSSAKSDAEYWCEEHSTEWFKRGKMKNYAHKIEGTNDWCNMSASNPGQRSSKQSSQSTNGPVYDENGNRHFENVGAFMNAGSKELGLDGPTIFKELGVSATDQIKYDDPAEWQKLEKVAEAK